MLSPLGIDDFRSGTGTLLYLVKHSRPDIANCVRELSKVMHVAGHAHYKMLLRAIKYVILTKKLGLKLKPDVKTNEPWQFETYVDRDWGGDRHLKSNYSRWLIFLLISNYIVFVFSSIL